MNEKVFFHLKHSCPHRHPHDSGERCPSKNKKCPLPNLLLLITPSILFKVFHCRESTWHASSRTLTNNRNEIRVFFTFFYLQARKEKDKRIS
jgi:hypothetical protein